MGFVIGTDEAGYGPNLGPLVISATVWETPDGIGGEELFDCLGHVIAQKPLKKGYGHPFPVPSFPPVVMGDSKALYSSGSGLHLLERGLWATLGLLGHCPRSWREIWDALSPQATRSMEIIPWYADYDGQAPVDCDAEELSLVSGMLREGLESAGVRLTAVRSRTIFAHEFNDLVELHGSKGEALSRQTLALAGRMMETLPTGPISVLCDKHGGRNRYAPLLMDQFPDCFVEIRGEGRERSVYRFGPADRRVEFCFRTKAESCLPAALASMASKYLREMAMRAFNQFWCDRVPGLQPTAGYPQDAKRFRADIAETQKRLHIEDRILWRVK